jgi:hypothetical protein
MVHSGLSWDHAFGWLTVKATRITAPFIFHLPASPAGYSHDNDKGARTQGEIFEHFTFA